MDSEDLEERKQLNFHCVALILTYTKNKNTVYCLLYVAVNPSPHILAQNLPHFSDGDNRCEIELVDKWYSDFRPLICGSISTVVWPLL